MAENESSERDRHDHVVRERIELVATVLLAMATLLTAWSAFQSTKWSGTQAIHFARAGADRTESAKAASRASAQTIIDVDTFVSWITALANERKIDPNASTAPDGSYKPDPTALSGFFFERLRDEFKPAVEAWVAQRPLDNPDAAPTPFSLPEYRLQDQVRADQLDASADHQSELARRDNQRGDNYVLTTVLFASVLFFAGISGKLTNTRNRLATVTLGAVVLVAGIGIILTFPAQV
jgi:hypothetical protein